MIILEGGIYRIIYIIYKVEVSVYFKNTQKLPPLSLNIQHTSKKDTLTSLKGR